MNLSGSSVWRDTQEGALFTRLYNTVPSWDEVDGRITFTTANGRTKVIILGEDLLNTIGYGARYAGVNVKRGVVNGKPGLY